MLSEFYLTKMLDGNDFLALQNWLSFATRRHNDVYIPIYRIQDLVASYKDVCEISFLEKFGGFCVIKEIREFNEDAMLILQTHSRTSGVRTTHYPRLGDKITMRFETEQAVIDFDQWILMNRKDL